MIFQYSTEARFVSEIPEDYEVSFRESVLHPFKSPPSAPQPSGHNRKPLNFLAFLFITLVDSTPFVDF